MPKPCSNDIRERVVEAILNGDSRRAAARRFKVSVSSAVKWMQRFRETGSLTPAPAGGRRRVAEAFVGSAAAPADRPRPVRRWTGSPPAVAARTGRHF